MPLDSAVRRFIAPGMLSLLFAAQPARAQDLTSILGNVGKFVSGFDAGDAFFAPAGFIHSDALKARDGMQQVGIALRNPTLDITVGYDLLTGWRAKEESLELRGGIAALPTITKYFDTVLPSVGPLVPSATVGFGVGLSQLQDTRASLAQSTGAGHIVKLSGNGYHVGVNLAFGVAIAENVGIYVEDSFRYTRFPSLDWADDKSIVPPAGWPTSLDLWTGTLRIGFGIGKE
jgi:hypothetical protein